MIEVICNPVAGPRRGNRIERVRDFLSSRGAAFRLRETGGPGDAILMAREAAHAGTETVIAVGGDGTLNEVANGLAGSATRLAAVPFGTGNVFAKEFHLPPTVEGCLDLLEEGKTVSVPLAKANDRYFVLFA
ncbi:MAG TPA: diacylglycerol kinase family protein, partial [Candidatus Deferrimicrobiaceae bacterium]